MGKSILSTVRFIDFTVRLSSENPPRRSANRNKVFVKKTRETKIDYSNLVKLEKAGEYSGSNPAPAPVPDSEPDRIPLAQVVDDCVRRWFQDTLKEARAGDVTMQILVGQMYFNGYGIPKDEQKGRAWINRASRVRSSAWQLSNKPPGYNASDSDSNDEKKD